MRQKILYMILAACLLLANASSPEVSAEQPASKKLSEQKEKMTYATVSFLEPETQAQQQRTTAIVKTSDKSGYYIDVFRS